MKTKYILFTIIITMLLTVLTGCKPSVEEIAGTYKGSYEENDDLYEIVIELNSDGTYYRKIYKNGRIDMDDMGDIEVQSKDEIVLINDRNDERDLYTYKDGVLDDGENELEKE